MAPRPGIEPGTARSKRAMMSVSPPGRERKRWESNPQGRKPRTRRFSGAFSLPLASASVSVDLPGIAPGFPVCRTDVLLLDDRPDGQWTARDLNPHFPRARRASSRWTSSPFSGDDGDRTHHKPLARRSRPLGTCVPILVLQRSARELNPAFLLTTEARRPDACRPSSDPGWS